MWALELADLLVFRRSLDAWGIRPRHVPGLWGVALAPFLHGGLGHLMANTIPLVSLGWLVMLRGVREFVGVSVAVALLGGLGVWLFARPGTIHIGASVLIFGYLGFLLFRGYFERSFVSILVAVLVGVVYGGALWGILPGQRGVSWEGHLFGFLAGALAAWALVPKR
ncbi:MAG: rhomboid family intramembrane serine protease [Chloroflexota bacterium]|nr:rhomboid family intramembrane serine protease [Chloroflexota bacterium]